jgi:hypothetical protein
MHRSGTSALMGALESSGVWLGPKPVNPAVKEQGALVGVNGGLLTENGVDWTNPLETLDLDTADPVLLRRTDRFLAQFDAAPLWGMKDPRLVFTLEYWLRRITARPRLIAVFRNPVSVAQSLHKRNPERFPLQAGRAIWRRYNRRLLRWVDDRRIPLVDFDAPESFIAQIASALHDVEGLDLARQDFFDASVPRHGVAALDGAEAEDLEIHQALQARSLARSGLIGG